MANQEKLLKKIESHLEDEEKVEQSVMGTYETKRNGIETVRSGVLVATNKKVLFFSSRLTGFDMEAFPYSNISSIELGKNLMGSKITLLTSGNRVDVKWIKPKGLPEFITLVKSRIGKPHSEKSSFLKKAQIQCFN